MKKSLVVLTGAGISAESGISTFRGKNGLWENHRIEDVATPQAFKNDPETVLKFYNQRRRQLLNVEPNAAHKALVKLEDDFLVTIITQNIDDLHERAGSSHVVHLHGELLKVQSSQRPELIYDWRDDVKIGDNCEVGSQLRPHVVWFGESVPMMEKAYDIVRAADIIVIIGTSMQVYPAASLVAFSKNNIPIFYIDPRPTISTELYGIEQLKVIETTAVMGIPILLEEIRKLS